MGKKSGTMLSAIFVVIAVIHAYWALGGRRGIDAVLPAENGKRTLHPSAGAIWAVVVALVAGIATTLGRMELWGRDLPQWLFRWGMHGMSAIFMLRAIGDFRVAGFSKRVKDTRFAWWDTRVYSPLCLVMAVLAALTDGNDER